VNEGEALILSAAGSTEPGLDFTAFRWDFDCDGTFERVGSESEVEWVWTVAGAHQARLVVEDDDGSSDEVTFVVHVNDLPPTLELDLPDNVVEGVPSSFKLIDLHDPGTSSFEVVWYMGDGTQRSGAEVEHTYLDQGDYQGHVTIKDNDGNVLRRDWPAPIVVANGNPILEIRVADPLATEDQEFTMKVFALDVANDTVTFSLKGARGKVDPETGLFSWTPGNRDVGQNSITFIASDEDGGTGEFTVIITVKDVDNDFFGISSVLGTLIIIFLVVCVVAVLMVRRKSGPSKTTQSKGRK
jgi:hypothetical protein